VITIVQAVN